VFDSSTQSFVEILSFNADQFFQPASNNKLLATSLAYHVLGGNFTFATGVFPVSPRTRAQQQQTTPNNNKRQNSIISTTCFVFVPAAIRRSSTAT
jgi:D-alanyl-D-alanine carboxypeptidase